MPAGARVSVGDGDQRRRRTSNPAAQAPSYSAHNAAAAARLDVRTSRGRGSRRGRPPRRLEASARRAEGARRRRESAGIRVEIRASRERAREATGVARSDSRFELPAAGVPIAEEPGYVALEAFGVAEQVRKSELIFGLPASEAAGAFRLEIWASRGRVRIAEEPAYVALEARAVVDKAPRFRLDIRASRERCREARAPSDLRFRLPAAGVATAEERAHVAQRVRQSDLGFERPASSVGRRPAHLDLICRHPAAWVPIVLQRTYIAREAVDVVEEGARIRLEISRSGDRGQRVVESVSGGLLRLAARPDV
ncbi:hypothetical protein PsYK624_170540 [Phanerochaete sordida]|uniref:Uncharacterized protein n=1 Tax=Phanerochaete sordida TaxID=48140 RepID=A0A9P3LPL8_9APHY|nr:hypothetical protein PsYK624_170540 [Phanerochaete sordida]